MENNNIKHNDPANNWMGSVIHAISIVAYPFESLSEKIQAVTDKFNEDQTPICDAKKDAFRSWFKVYYENPEKFKHYGLTVVEPW